MIKQYSICSEIHWKNRAPCKVTQAHRKWHGSIWCLWLPITDWVTQNLIDWTTRSTLLRLWLPAWATLCYCCWLLVDYNRRLVLLYRTFTIAKICCYIFTCVCLFVCLFLSVNMISQNVLIKSLLFLARLDIMDQSIRFWVTQSLIVSNICIRKSPK